ncbi:hypothetical protein BDZ94DRAFT_1249167 [Collybia nuda]|uniref:Glucose receptor Git3 N-terminal domain-containing protein n=1 Tax=Collybia nuda TaxID=64659 RepID=A0A9P5YEG4_9AGAR|nr:hypothetical protein BDZ94DRAFT_1249167 [Collybia nuda]
MASAIPPYSGIICTEEQYIRSLNSSAIYCLTRSQSIGLTIVAETGLASLFAVCFVFVIIIRNTIQHIRHAPAGKFTIVREPMDIFMLSLFVADFVQALGAVMDIKWIRDGKVEIGAFCTAQGETGVAITTLLIAIYTFIGVWWRIGMGMGSVRVAKVIIGLVWLFIILMVVIGNATHSDKNDLYQSPTPYWCWIGEDYMQFRIWGEYVWFWITLVFSFLAYIPLFLWSRGNITFSEYSWWRFSIHRASKFDNPYGTRRQSLAMIAYPVVYSILIIPLSVVRWIGFVQERGGRESHIGAAATMSVIGIYGLSGACNVILLLTTRPNSILFSKGLDYEPRHTAAGMATYKSSSINETMGEQINDLGRPPSRSSVGWS